MQLIGMLDSSYEPAQLDIAITKALLESPDIPGTGCAAAELAVWR